MSLLGRIMGFFGKRRGGDNKGTATRGHGVETLEPRTMLSTITPVYSIRSVGEVSNTVSVVATGINNAGQVAGVVDWTNVQMPVPSVFRTGRNAALNQATDLLGTGLVAQCGGINNYGQVAGKVGQVFPASAQTTFRTAPNGTIASSTLALGGMDGLNPAGVNDSGVTVLNDSESHVVYVSSGNRSTAAPVRIAGDAGAQAVGTGVNSAGAVVGYITSGATPASKANTQGFIYYGSNPFRFYMLGQIAGSVSHAYGINSVGTVVGDATVAVGRGSLATFAMHAVRFDLQAGRGGTPTITRTDLGSLGGAAKAEAINRYGVIVGESALLRGRVSHGFVYINGHMIDLNTLVPATSGWVLTDAVGINDRGQIVGNGLYHGAARAFVMTPA